MTATFEQAENILCVRLDTLGDILMTTPAIRALKEAKAGRRITLLTSEPGAVAARLVPEIDEIIIYDAPWLKATAPRASSQPEYAMIEHLRQRGFDAAVIFTVYSQNPLPSAFLCYMADIPLRLAHCHENSYQLLTHWVNDPEPARGIRHEVQRQLDLVATVEAKTDDVRMSLRFEERDRQHAFEMLASLNLDLARPWTIIHPGSTATSRRYAPESFAAAARILALKYGFQVLFTGTSSEHELVSQIQESMGVPSVSLVDNLSLAELAALIALAPVLISNNTGPVHVAAAVGTPVVDLYALTNPQHTPWAVPCRVLNHDVPCKYCYKSVCPEGHHNCLRLVTPEEVVAATLDLLSETGQRNSTPAASTGVLS
ncbi:MAG TPA: lipopolysaccharide heptosyltransferase II [Chloroflexia bacterium]|nr:lipopolysaccharide heptosyltransferase II [Chloroflexia bacterium]